MSTHYDCLIAVRDTIQGLDLAGLADESVLVLKLPVMRFLTNLGVDLPAVLITPGPGRLTGGGDNVNDDTDYAVNVLAIMSDSQERTGTANLDKLAGWMQRIRRAFHHKAPVALATVYDCHVAPGPPVDLTSWAMGYLASGLVVTCRAREPRTDTP